MGVGLAIAVADRGRRIDDDGVEAVPGGFEDEGLRCELRPLVRDRELPVGRSVELGGGATAHRPARAGSARVDEPADATPKAGFEHVARPFDVDALDHSGVGLVAVQRCDVEDRVAARDRPGDSLTIEEVDPLGPHVRAQSRSTRATWLPTKPVAPVT